MSNVINKNESIIRFDSNGKPIVPDNKEEITSSNRLFERLSKRHKDVLKAYKCKEMCEQDLDMWKAMIKTQVEDVLYQVGKLSLEISILQEPLKNYYYKTLKPAMGDTMFKKEFDEWTEPYDTLKNKCFQLMGKIIGEEL
jgi:hypothetical protein